MIEDREVPQQLPDGEVTVLGVNGSLFVVWARDLEEQLPAARSSRDAVVVRRQRGHEEIGATFIDVLDDYADDLEEGGGRLYLTGLSDTMSRQLRLSDMPELGEGVHLRSAEPRLGASTPTVLDANPSPAAGRGVSRERHTPMLTQRCGASGGWPLTRPGHAASRHDARQWGGRR